LNRMANINTTSVARIIDQVKNLFDIFMLSHISYMSIRL
jgi:hypothetical protein